jgi:hypothetical protein
MGLLCEAVEALYYATSTLQSLHAMRQERLMVVLGDGDDGPADEAAMDKTNEIVEQKMGAIKALMQDTLDAYHDLCTKEPQNVLLVESNAVPLHMYPFPHDVFPGVTRVAPPVDYETGADEGIEAVEELDDETEVEHSEKENEPVPPPPPSVAPSVAPSEPAVTLESLQKELVDVHFAFSAETGHATMQIKALGEKLELATKEAAAIKKAARAAATKATKGLKAARREASDDMAELRARIETLEAANAEARRHAAEMRQAANELVSCAVEANKRAAAAPSAPSAPSAGKRALAPELVFSPANTKHQRLAALPESDESESESESE